jgi:MFS family permease
MSPKLLAKNMAVVASAFVWYFLAYRFIDESATAAFPTSDPKAIIVGAGTVGIAVFAVLGSLLANKLHERRTFLVSWMLAGVFFSLIPFYLPPSSLDEFVAVSAIFGSYFGLGMPATMAFFASSTNAENRGRTAGVTFLAIGMSFSIVGLFLNTVSVGVDSAQATSIALAGIRLTGLILFLLLGAKEEPYRELNKSACREIVRNRTFVLYFIPWIMFNVVDYLTITVTKPPFDVGLASAMENSLIAVCAIVAGFLIDTKGRKRLSIFGFAFLALGYASLGLFSGTTGWFFYTIADGIAWGIFNVVFLFTLWGDITHGRDSEKIYVMGALPFLFSNFMYVLAESETVKGIIPPIISPYQIFTFASLFLFLAVLPLVFAPETLSEKVMKDLELNTYLKKAKEIATKAHQKEEREEEDTPLEFVVAQEDAEETEKIAEKHY